MRLSECRKLLGEHHSVVRHCSRTFGPLNLLAIPRFASERASDKRLCLLHVPNVNISEHGRLVIRVTRQNVTAGIRFGPLPVVATCGGVNFSVTSFPGTCRRCRGRVALPLGAGLDSRSIRCVVGGLLRVLRR